MAFKKLTAGLMASSMILGLATTAAAEITTATPFETAVKMNKLGVVKGVGTLPTGEIDFNLGGNLTRAELVTTIVRSFGFESAAQVSKGAPSFADVAGSEWYSGYVAVAKNLAEQQGTTIGRDSHTFDPNGNVSKAEALVFVMKFLGIKVTSTGANWYEAWIAKAVEMGMISQADAAIALANPGSSATRGEAFVILDFGYSAKVLEGGASLYTAYVDSVKPTVEASAAETTAETKITVSGKVSDDKAVAAVFVNGTAVEIKDGNFSADVELKVGENSIEISATDAAGNTAAKTLKVTRANAEASTIEAADVAVAAGESATVAVKLLDANGAEIADAAITGTSTLGTYADGKFTAGTKAGEGTLTLKAGSLEKTVAVKVAAGALAKVSASKSNVAVQTSVTLSAQDQYGNAVTGASFTVKAGQTGAFVTGDQFLATAAGNFTVVATSNGASVESTIGVYSETVASLAVTATDTLVANGSSTVEVTVKALDANGNFIPTATGAFTVSAPGLSVPANVDLPALASGKATFEMSAEAAVAGQALTLTATHTASGKSGKLNVTPVAQVATKVGITAATNDYLDTTAAGATKALTVNVLDQAGVKMIAGEYSLKLAITGPATFANAATSKTVSWNKYTGDAHTIYATETAATGAITITGTVEGLEVGTKTITAAVPQAVAAIKVTAPTSSTITAGDAADTSLVYKITTTDKYGVPVAGTGNFKLVIGGIDMTDVDDLALFNVEYSNDATGNVWLPLADAATAFPKTAKRIKIYGTTVGSYSVQVVDAASPAALTASATNAFGVQAGSLNKLSAPSTVTYEALRGEKVTAKYQLTDSEGNPVKAAGVKVTTSAPSAVGMKINGGTTAATVETDADGVATFEVTADKLDTFTFNIASVTNGGTALPGALPGGVFTLNAVDAVVGSFTVAVANQTTPANVYVTAGENAKLTVTVKDNLGYDFTTLDVAGFTSAFALKNGQTAVDLTGKVTLAGGVFTISNVPLTKAGVATLTLTTKKLAEAKSVSAMIAVRAAAASRAIVIGADAVTGNTSGLTNWNYSADTTANVAKVFTVQLADQYGNVINASDNGTLRTFSLAYSDNSKYFTFADQDGVGLAGSKLTIAAGRNTASFTAIVSAEVGNITVTDDATTLSSATISLK